MNILSKEYYRRKRKKQRQTKIFNIIMILAFLFMLAFSIQMVRKWRELGLICLQVAEGDF